MLETDMLDEIVGRMSAEDLQEVLVPQKR